MSWVSLSKMPKARKTQSYFFPALNGGLNLRDAEINLADNESPELLNVWWSDGALQGRPGQEWASEAFAESAVAFAASTEPFNGLTFLHINASLCYVDCQERTEGLLTLHQAADGLPPNRGNFVRFGDYLYYKNVGGFYRISVNGGSVGVSSVADDAFVPTIVINANPASGSGDLYQPENRLSPLKRVSYNASCTPSTVIKNGDGLSRLFTLGVTSTENLRGVRAVYVGDAYKEPALYDFNARSGSVLFNKAPAKGATITFELDVGNCEYHLPVENVAAVTEVKVDGLAYVAGQDYSVDLGAGVVTFAEAPPVTDPPTNNTVEITYSKDNAEALSAVMSCPYLTAYGSGVRMCLVAGGCAGVPNAVYWSGSTSVGLDASYWPVSHYNYVGDAVDRVTGFGRQYDQLIVFKARSVGKLDMGTESVNGRDEISLYASTVNPRTGCDVPDSVQTIENNLVFANASGGVYRILSASAAYENNIQSVSEKVNGSNVRPGLLYDLRVAGQGPVRSFDDGQRYWLSVNRRVWVWDYAVGAWFVFDGFDVADWFQSGGVTYALHTSGRVVRLGETFSDFGGPIQKVYQFPARHFGSYDRLKDVRSLLISVRGDVPSDTALTYRTDAERRTERVNLTVAGYDRLTNRNLEVRDLSVQDGVKVFRREPECMDVRHFSVRFENNDAGKDLNVYSLEVQARFAGRER